MFQICHFDKKSIFFQINPFSNFNKAWKMFVSHYNFFLKVMQSVDDEEEETGQPEQQENFYQNVGLKLLLLGTFTCQGAYKYIPGPTLIDLHLKVSQPIVIMPLIFTARAVGYIVGCILAGFLFQWLLHSNQKSLFLSLITFLMASSSFIVSVNNTITGIMISFCASGFCMSVVDLGMNAICLHSRFQATRTFFLVIQLFYCIGAFSAPFIARSYVDKSINLSLVLPNTSTEEREHYSHPDWQFKDMTRISYAYAAISFNIIIVALFWLAHYCLSTSDHSQDTPKRDKEDLKHKIIRNLSIFNGSVLIFFSESVALSYAEMLPIYSNLVLNFNQVQGLDMMALFLGFQCVGRLIMIRMPQKSSHTMLILGNSLMICGSIMLHYLVEDYAIYIWFANAIIGLGVGPLLPCAFSWLQRKWLLRHRNVLPLFFMTALSELIMTWIISYYTWNDSKHVKHILLSVSIIHFAFLVVQFILLNAVHKKHKKPNDRKVSETILNPSFIQLSIENIDQQARQEPLPQTDPLIVDQDEFDPSTTHQGIVELRQRVEQGSKGVFLLLKTMENVSLK